MEPEQSADAHGLPNCYSELNGTTVKVAKEVYKQENIFLFAPNIIGVLSR